MYRIIIADDEQSIRELLAKKINQSGREFMVVGTAENGGDAIGMVKQLQPDILITDICMPKLSGLDLIKAIQDLKQPVKTVVISGYDDFSYAKKAMSLGVTDYLLKPFLPDEMFEVLDKIKEELEHQEILKSNMMDMQAQIEDSLMVLREKLFKDLLLGSRDFAELSERSQRAAVDFKKAFYCTGILRIQSPLTVGGQEKSRRMIFDFLAIIKDDYFSPGITTEAIMIEEEQLVFLFCGDFKNQLFFYQEIRKGMEKINVSLEKYYHMNLWCALGNIYDDWREVSTSYREALSIWKGILDGAECIISYSELKSQSQDEKMQLVRPRELENTLLLNIQMGRTEKAEMVLDEIFRYYEPLSRGHGEFVSISLVELVFAISNALVKAGGNLKVWEDEKVVDYLKKHFTHYGLMDARGILREYIEKCCAEFRTANEKQGDRIVYNIKLLIEENIGNEGFHLESASAALFFSHNYVRQIFKQKTGESFMEYLIRRRMETAKELLEHSSYKIQEIAFRTGYSNQRYFASCFKKYYGRTPTDFRNRR